MKPWERRNMIKDLVKDAPPNYGGGPRCANCGDEELHHRTFPGEDGKCMVIGCKCPGWRAPAERKAS